MPGPTFPLPTAEVIATLAELFRHQNETEIVALLESAHARFEEGEYDNWNGGTQYWSLQIEVPVGMFAAVQRRLEGIQKKIHAMLGHLSARFPSDPISSVVVLPITVGLQPLGQRMAPSEIEVRRLWGEGNFRLFLSHVSNHKVPAAVIKEALWLRGIHAFVAHEDIEPSLDWQPEIELALRSMHALAALITSDFHPSKWTDQEIGWALGRGVAVQPIKLPENPYGLIQKIQGLPGTLSHPKKLAALIAATLLSNRQTRGEMRRAVIHTFAGASSAEMAKALRPLLLSIDDIAPEERATVWQACTNNVHVRADVDLCNAIYSAFGAPPVPQPSSVIEDEIPF